MTARKLDISHINLSFSHRHSVIWVSLEDVCLGSPHQSFLPYTPPPQGALLLQRWTLDDHHTPNPKFFPLRHVALTGFAQGLSWLLSSGGPPPVGSSDHPESLRNTETPRLLPRGQVPWIWSEVVALLIPVMPQARLSCSSVQNQMVLWRPGARQNACGALTHLTNCGLREAEIPSVLLTTVSLVHQGVAWHTLVLCVLSRVQPTRLLCPWNFPGKNTAVGCHFLLQGTFPTQGSNPRLLH